MVLLEEMSQWQCIRSSWNKLLKLCITIGPLQGQIKFHLKQPLFQRDLDAKRRGVKNIGKRYAFSTWTQIKWKMYVMFRYIENTQDRNQNSPGTFAL